MRKLIFCTLCIVFINSYSQSVLEVQGNTSTLYFNHSIADRESLLTLAVLYRLSPNTIANFNAMGLGSQLNKGQVIKIPVTATNYSTSGTGKSGAETLLQIVLPMEEKSTVQQVEMKYKIADSVLKKYNPGIVAAIPAGTRLVVGYVRTMRMQSNINSGTQISLAQVTNTNTQLAEEKMVTRPVTPAIGLPAFNNDTTNLQHGKANEQPWIKSSTLEEQGMETISTTAAFKVNETKPLTGSNNSLQANGGALETLPDSISKLGSDDLFQLARKAAFDNKNYPLALVYCNKALEKSPAYNDIRVFKGRLYNWTGRPDSASAAFEMVLAREPDNLEAYLAYIDLERWNDHYNRALALADSGLIFHPQSSQLLLSKARVLVNLKQPIEANKVLEQLFQNDATNTAARALSLRLKTESFANSIGFTYDYYYFDKQFSDPWHLVSLDYRRQTKIGSMGAHINYANRFKKSGVQYEIDGYPHIMNHVYAYFSLAYSADVGVFAKYRGGTSLYISLPKSYDAEIGFRYLYFSNPTWIYTIAAGKYYKNWYLLARTYLTPGNKNISQSYNLTARYYFGGANDFVALTIGNGISPDESRSDILLNSTYKLVSKKISANYRHAIRSKYILSLSAGWVNQEYRPKTKGNQLDAGVGLQLRF